MKLSDEGRDAIVEGQKRRWAKHLAEHPDFPCGHPRTEDNSRPSHRERAEQGRKVAVQCRACEVERSRKLWAERKDAYNAARRAKAKAERG